MLLDELEHGRASILNERGVSRPMGRDHRVELVHHSNVVADVVLEVVVAVQPHQQFFRHAVNLAEGHQLGQKFAKLARRRFRLRGRAQGMQQFELHAMFAIGLGVGLVVEVGEGRHAFFLTRAKGAGGHGAGHRADVLTSRDSTAATDDRAAVAYGRMVACQGIGVGWRVQW